MNPSFLFPNVETSTWEYVAFDGSPPAYAVVICHCSLKPKFLKEGKVPTIKDTHGRVEVKPYVFDWHGQGAIVYMGQCNDCGKAFWTAWKFHWLMWMTPKQKWESLLAESRNAHYRSHEATNSSRGTIVIEDLGNSSKLKRELTVIFDHDGSVKYVTYHTYEYPTEPNPPDNTLHLGDLM